MEATFDAPRSPSSMFLIALALFGALSLGGVSGYLLKSLQAQPSATVTARATGSAVAVLRPPSGILGVDPLTGRLSGGADDQWIRATLSQSGYEGGATVVQSVDPLTGYRSGSLDDQRILAILKQSGYEGGATLVQVNR
jgi:hypothetical protein